MTKLFNFFLCLLLTLTFGCTSDNSDTPPDIVPTIADEFNIQLWEHLSPNGNSLSLLVETIEDHDCLNSIIRNEISIQSTNLIVNLDGIVQPENCIEGIAPAAADVSFSTLPIGNYDLEINILSLIKNVGFIDVSPNTFKIELNSSDGIHISNNELNRIPNNTFWGYIALDKMDLTTVTSGFLEEIEILKDDFSFDNGNYGHFKFTDEVLDFEVSTAFPDHEKFAFKYSGDLKDLTRTIKEYRENSAYLNKLEIRVLTFEGEEL